MNHRREPLRLKEKALWRSVMGSAAEDEPTEHELKRIARGLPLRAGMNAIGAGAAVGFGLACGLAFFVLQRVTTSEPVVTPDDVSVPVVSVQVIVPDAGARAEARVPGARPLRKTKSVDAPIQELSADAGPSELLLVEEAFRELRVGNEDVAMALALRHEALFPEGAFVEERERIIIEALARTDRIDEAKTRLRNFLATFPSSSLREQIEDVIHRAEDRMPSK